MSPNRHRDRIAPGPVTPATLWRRLERQHLIWGGTALVVSLALHGLLLLFFPGFDLSSFLHRQVIEAQRPFRVLDVRIQAPEPEVVPQPAPAAPERPQGVGPAGSGAGPTEAAAALGRAPDEAMVAPPPSGPGSLIGKEHGLYEPAQAEPSTWQPRADILQIERKIVPDEVNAVPRRYTPTIQRLSGAADIVQPVERPGPTGGAGAASVPGTSGEPARFAWGQSGGGSGTGGEPTPPQQPPSALVPAVPEANDLARANLKRLEKLLRADVYVYRAINDPAYSYCRIEIKRRGDDVLPVLPKDVLLVQDASASITEQKMHYCREGMLRALDQLAPADRFNVIEFRDRTRQCFTDWAPVSPETIGRAREFVDQLRSEGNTDIYTSLKELLAMPRQPGRPVIMEVVSDGVATVGLTDQSLIIEAFSQANEGHVSVFTTGTYPGVNAYLLDLLSYRNRGDTVVVRTGRWDIPAVIESRLREVARPVLNDVRFRFAGQGECDVLPRLTPNLYMDKPLVLYARYPRDVKRLVFQATGQAGDITCDMVFDLDLAQALAGDKEIRTQWAWQKVYELIGEHNRTHDSAIVDAIRSLGRTYGIRIPYRSELKD